MIVDIIEDAAARKISVEAQFQKFVEAGAQQGRPKKVKIANTSTAENVVNLVFTPPTPSPTQIMQEAIPELPSISPVDICKNAMPKTLKERFDQDIDFQAYIKKLPELLTFVEKITTKCPLFETGGSRQRIPQAGQIP